MEKFSLIPFALINVQKLYDSMINAEAGWNFEESAKILSPVWTNFDRELELDGFSDLEKAKLLRVCGNFLIKTSNAKIKPAYNERGKNMLSEAVRLFDELGEISKSVEADVMLGFSYYLEGRNDEFDIFLDRAENKLDGKHLDYAYLKIQVNRLIYFHRAEKFTEAFELIKNLRQTVAHCKFQIIKRQFYIEAGLNHRRRSKFAQALEYYKLATQAAIKTKNLRVKGVILNNTAIVYLHMGKFDLALRTSNRSIKIYKGLKDFGWIAHGLDTNAQIYFAEKDYKSALRSIDAAIMYFRQMTDVASLIESLWFKVKILITLNRNEQAVDCWQELKTKTLASLGEKVLRNYEIKFIKEFKKTAPQEIESEKISSFRALPRERINFDNLNIKNTENLLFYKFSTKASEKYLNFIDVEIIALVEAKATLEEGDLILFETETCQLEVGELIGPHNWQKKEISLNKLKIESSLRKKKYKFREIDHIGKIIGICRTAELEKPEIIFKNINDLTF